MSYLINTNKKKENGKKKKRMIEDTKEIKSFKLTISEIQLITIEVKGFELSVLKSIMKCIKKYRPIILLEKGKDIKKIYNLLKKLSYKQ